VLKLAIVCTLICAALGHDAEVHTLEDNPQHALDTPFQVAAQGADPTQATGGVPQDGDADPANATGEGLTHLNQHLKKDVANAKTVQEVESAVEKGVATALATKGAADKEEQVNQKVSETEKQTELAKTEADTERMKAETKTEEIKASLEKAHQATIKENQRNVEIEAKLEANVDRFEAKSKVEADKVDTLSGNVAELSKKVEGKLDTKQIQPNVVASRVAVMEPSEKLEMDHKLQINNDESEVAIIDGPKTLHEIHLAEAAAFKQAAISETKEAQALNKAGISKTKFDAQRLVKTTSDAEAQALADLQKASLANEDSRSDAQTDLKKALDTPFNGEALQNVVHEKKELKDEKRDISVLRTKYERTKVVAAAAKKAVEDGELTGWGGKSPEPVAKPMLVVPTGPRSTSASRLTKTDKDKRDHKVREDNHNQNNVDNMSDDDVAYWLGKKMESSDVDPRTPEQVMKEMFEVKQTESEKIQSLRSLQKHSLTDTAPDADTDLVVDGSVARAPATLMAPSKSMARSETEKVDTGNTEMSQEHMQLKMDEIAQAHERESEAATTTAKADTPALSKNTAPANTEEGQIEAAQEARKQVKNDPPAPAPVGDMAVGDMGETAEVSATDYANEVSADSVLEHDDIGATDGGEGIDEANADAETDDMSVEDDGFSVEDDDEGEDSSEEE